MAIQMRRTLPLLGLLGLAAAAPCPAGAADGFGDQVSQAINSARESAAKALARPKPKPQEPRSAVIRVLTYNIHGIPTQPKEGHNRYREIGRRLGQLRKEGRAPQIVAIQEGFHGRTAELVSEAGYPYVQAGASSVEGKLMGSGLYILSEYPIESWETIDYQACAGWDCLANKGVLHVRVKIPEIPQTLDLYTTHLNADANQGGQLPPEETLKARLAQIGPMTDFVQKTRKEGAPAILAADFNFKPDGSDYQLFAKFPGISNAAENCFLSRRCSGDGDPEGVWRSFVDHQFYLSDTDPQVGLEPIHVEQTFKEPVNGAPLSDHWGLEVHYRASW